MSIVPFDHTPSSFSRDIISITSADGGDSSGSENAMERHKCDLEALAKSDPAFYEHLKKENPEVCFPNACERERAMLVTMIYVPFIFFVI